MKYLPAILALVCSLPATAQLRAGIATVSITPLEEKIPTQLGGYGAREGKPAEGIHDTLHAKILVLEWAGKKSVLMTLDVCSVPICMTQEALAKAGIQGVAVEDVLACASHTHAGLEGMALDRRNVANNPNIGLFSEPMLNFVTDRLAKGLREADAALQPVKAAAGVVKLPGMNRNRRGDTFIDEDMTLLRFDKADGKPLMVFVNYTAHGTIMTEHEMLISGGWSGNMQRTVEALMPGVTCMYTNGAEGDVAPNGAHGGSRWEMAEDYGRRVGIVAANLARSLHPSDVKVFLVQSAWVALPPRKGAPDFVKIAGDEYKVTQEQLDTLLQVMFPEKAPIYGLRINDFEMATFPGEPICQLGLSVKDTLRKDGIKYPCVAALTTDHIGYILTKEQYAKSGYEVTASFYGDGLGDLMLKEVTVLAKKTAQ